MKRAYKTFLGLYPRDYRALFAGEMLNAFERVAEECRAQGRAVFIRFTLGELAGLVISAGAEWIAKLTTDKSIRGRCLPDVVMMRPPGVLREVWFAAAPASVCQNSLPDEMIRAHERIAFLVSRTVHAIANHDFQGARLYSCEEREARESFRLLQQKHKIEQ
jgi:hypothetical protein